MVINVCDCRHSFLWHRVYASPMFRLRTFLLLVLVMATAIPLSLITVFHAHTFATVRENALRSRLKEASSASAAEIGQYVLAHQEAIIALRDRLEAAPVADQPALQKMLDSVRVVYPSFMTMLIADERGEVLVWSNRNTVPPRTSLQVSDREYFQKARGNRDAQVTNAFRGRGFGNDPIIGISAEAVHGTRKFVVEGSLDVLRFNSFESRFQALEGMRFVVVDGAQHVIYASSSTRLQPLMTVAGSKWDRTADSFWDPGEELIISSSNVPGLPWRTYVATSWAGTRRTVRLYWFLSLGLAIVATAVAAFAARRIAAAVTQPMESMTTAIIAMEQNLKPAPVVIRKRVPGEIRRLVEHFNQSIASMEQMIRGMVPICSSCRKIREDGKWISVERYLALRTEGTPTHGMCPDCIRKHYPEIADSVLEQMNEAKARDADS